jgi:hypothetical protein
MAKINVISDSLGNEFYQATANHETFGKLNEVKFQSKKSKEIIDFLVQYNVEKCEAERAIDLLDIEGHNAAIFGVLGTLILTKYEGQSQ